MPTDVQKFSTGYKGKTSRPRRTKEVAGPYRSDSTSAAVRAKSTPREHRRVPVSSGRSDRSTRRRAAEAAALAVKPPNPKSESKAERRRKAAAVAVLRRSGLGRGTKPPKPTVPTAGQPASTGKGPSRTQALELAVDKDVVKPLQAEGKLPKHKTVGQDVYDKVAQAGIVLAPEARGVMAGAKGVGAALRGAVDAEGTRVGGSKVLSRVLKPVEATTAEGRQAILSRAAEKAATKESSGVKAAAGRVARTVTRADAKADAVVARRVAGRTTRREAAAAAGPPLKVAKVTAAQALPVVQGHERAIAEHPGKVAKTTARAIPGLVTAPVGQAIGLGVTAGRAVSEGAHLAHIPGARGYSGKEILAPAAGVAKEQLDFARSVAKTLTADDSAQVQKAVEDELGLLLPVMLGLGVKGAAEKLTKGRVEDAVRRVVEDVRSKAGRGHGRHNGETPRVFEVAGQRKREAVRTATHRARVKREVHDRTKNVRHEAGRAKGSEVLRAGVTRRGRILRRRGDLKIHTGDVVGFAVRHDLPLDKPAAALAEVKRIGGSLKPLPKGVELPADQLSTRDVIGFIERNPHVLADKHLAKAVHAYRRQGRYAREHAAELAPEHSERARYTPAAVTRGIPLTQERFPNSVRDIVRAEPTRGRVAKDVLRRESRSDRRRARRLGKKASREEGRARIMRREAAIRASQVEPRAATELARKERIRRLEDRRARIAARRQELRDRGSQSKQMGQYRRMQEKINRQIEEISVEPMTARKKQRIQLERHAEGRSAVAGRQRRMAKAAGEAATKKFHAATEVDTSIDPEFVNEVRSRLKSEGMSGQPEYVSTGRAKGPAAPGITATKVSRFPGRSKFRKGTAEEYGMAQEGLASTLRESVARPVSRRESFKAMRGFLDENGWRDEKGRREFTANQIQKLYDDGKVSRDAYVAIPRQDYKRTFSPEQWTAHLGEALKAGEADALEQGPRYMLVRRPAATEFADQLAGEVFSPRLARINRATSYLILGTSPAWAAAQIVAEYSQAAAAQPRILNPAFVRKAIKAYKSMAPHERQAFDSWVGVTARELDTPGDLKLDLKTGDMQAASDAWSVMNRTPLGRAIKSIPSGLHRLDQWKGGRIRVLAGVAKIDSDLNRRGGSFLRGIKGMDGIIGKVSKELAGKPLSEQLAYMSDHPDVSRHYQAYLDDVLGNWSALTKNERLASQFAIFYPFMRMSLRWTFYAFPKHHPIKAATLLYLGQQNATELRKLLGRDPSYFTEWAQVPLHLGDGKVELIPLQRVATGFNTAIELIGEGGDPFLLPMKVAQPFIAAVVEGMTGVSALSGEVEAESVLEKGALAAANLLSLPAPGRVAQEHIVPKGQKPTHSALPILGPLFGSTERQQALDKLFSKLEEKGTAARALRSTVNPLQPKNINYEKDLIRLRETLDTIAKNSGEFRRDIETAWAYEHKGGGKKQVDAKLTKMENAYEAGQKELDRLLAKYKIPFKAEEEEGGQRYSEIHYGAKPESARSTYGGERAEPDTSSPTEGKSTYGGERVESSSRPREPRFYTPDAGGTSTYGGVR